MKLFDVFAASPSSELSIEELASKAKGSEQLTGKILPLVAIQHPYSTYIQLASCHLTTSGILEETSPGKYKARPLGRMCNSTSPAADAVINLYVSLLMTGSPLSV